ncbi:MAG: D-glycero-beta-D-manno-heptose 1,7-bisphosphate 7-phosphatase [Campylobacteraceae bacterium]|jgi:D-glycero-D-manno-heptose 1,7-bisphosphate phosphatase|nr:D-glycero-beta-D-manno-heptose 1,7-bisphosphate 7-phosphatase [Campylobacteraceae bacterium]
MAFKAVFLDRDGVINEDKGYVYKQKDFIFTDGIFETLKHFQECGYLLFVVTNQSGIGRGYYTEEEFLALNNYMLKEFEKEGVKISKVYYCPHAPEIMCACRKPNPKMLLEAQKEFDIDMNASWLIGDNERDMEAGLRAGVKNLILLGESCIESVKKIKSIKEAIDIIS